MANIVALVDASNPDVCEVMYCVAAPHDGTDHVDATGEAFRACAHGTLAHWDPCDECPPAEWARFTSGD